MRMILTAINPFSSADERLIPPKVPSCSFTVGAPLRKISWALRTSLVYLNWRILLDSALMMVAKTVHRAITAGIERDQIAIVGFSQGACLATEFVVRNAARYGGVIAFTGGLIGPPGTKFVYSGELLGTACFLGAGDRDPHVPWKRVEESASVLSALGGVVTLRRYPGLPHTINRDEIEHAKTILRRLIAKERAV